MIVQAGPDDRGIRLDIFLARHLEGLTRSQIQLLNRCGAVRVDGHQVKAGYRIRGGETIQVELTAVFAASPALRPEQMPLQLYYEDEDFAVVEKPAGLVVHPGAGVREGTLVHGLLHYFRNLSDAGGELRPGIVHRLDRWTSGLLLIAKNNTIHARLSQAFQDRRVGKTYLVLVHGKLPRTSGTIELTIRRHPVIRRRMAAQPAGGRAARTEYRLLEGFKNFSFLEVTMATGRTHQIRVHLSAIGHPVVGDDVYGERQHRQFIKKYGQLGRYFLHAASLRLKHPRTGEPLEFHSPLPQELKKFLERINL